MVRSVSRLHNCLKRVVFSLKIRFWYVPLRSDELGERTVVCLVVLHLVDTRLSSITNLWGGSAGPHHLVLKI